jgi:hypothetical protein
MEIVYQRPSEKLIKQLKKGLIVFYPDEVRAIFGLGKTKLPFHDNWNGWSRFEFADFTTNITKTNDVDSAARVVLSWERKENLTETVPSNINDLMEDLDRQKSAEAKRRAAKETLLAAQKDKESQETAATQKPDTPLTQAEAVAVKGAEIVGIQIDYAKVNAGEQFRAQSRTATTRWAIAHSYEKLREKDPEKAAAISMWAHGIRSVDLESKIKEFPDEHAKKLEKIIEAIKGLETDPIQTQFIRQSFPIKDINFILGPETGITQSELMVFFYPPEEGGTYIPQHTSFLGSIAWSAGEQLFKKWATKQAGKLLVKAGVKTGAKTLVTTGVKLAAGEATGVGIGSVAGPIGTLVGVAVGFLVGLFLTATEKFLGWLKKNSRDVLFGSVALLAYGSYIGSPVLIGASLGTGALAALNGGFSGALDTLAGFATSMLSAMTSLFVSAVGIPLLIALIATPLIITIILVIINSGAYVVPPSPLTSVEQNPYIAVVKEVKPSGPFDNSELPITVDYTITVTAKKSTLTNISFKHVCEIMTKSGKSACPAPLPTDILEKISPIGSYVYTYTQTYGGPSYRDSLVINTFTVTADTPEEAGVSASGVASIIIGKPPTGCYNVAGDWPSSERASIMAAIANLIGGSSNYVARLCATWPEVKIYYASKVCGAWGCAPGGNIIYLNSEGLKNTTNATFILAHESAHVLNYGDGSYMAAYRSYPGTLEELPVCGYCCGESEGFAEAIGRYAVGSACLNNHPNNKKFVELYIFK